MTQPNVPNSPPAGAHTRTAAGDGIVWTGASPPPRTVSADRWEVRLDWYKGMGDKTGTASGACP